MYVQIFAFWRVYYEDSPIHQRLTEAVLGVTWEQG